MFVDPRDLSDVLTASLPARGFYQRPTVDVARGLLGLLLVRHSPDGLVAVRINEVEAYLGPTDRACHTWDGRRTERVRSMWGEAGSAYVYLIYGLHHCLNVVTVGFGAGQAALIRGGVVVHGHDLVSRRRGTVPRARMTDGPGKLCQALDVDRRLDGCDLCGQGDGLWIANDGVRVSQTSVRETPRIGVESAGDAADWPLRFVVEV